MLGDEEVWPFWDAGHTAMLGKGNQLVARRAFVYASCALSHLRAATPYPTPLSMSQ